MLEGSFGCNGVKLSEEHGLCLVGLIWNWGRVVIVNVGEGDSNA